MRPDSIIPPTCVIDGCDRKPSGRGLCSMHYQRVLTSGEPMPPTTRGKQEWTPADILPTEAAYLAGIFDGEGSITISYRRRANQNPECFLYILITMSDEEIIRCFHHTFGGWFNKQPPGPGKQLYRWGLRNAHIAMFLATIQPYLRIKQPQAKLACEFLAQAYQPTGRRQLAAETVQYREWAREEMSRLNHSHHRLKRRVIHS